MLQAILAFFRTGPDAAPGRRPGRHRPPLRAQAPSVFLSVTLGYGLFYTTRINFSVVKKPMLDAGILNATQMGLIGPRCCWSIPSAS